MAARDVKEARRYDRNARRDDDAQLREYNEDARNAPTRAVGRAVASEACSPLREHGCADQPQDDRHDHRVVGDQPFLGLCQWWIDAVGHQHVGHQWCDHRQARDDDEDRRRDDKRGGAELCFGQCEGRGNGDQQLFRVDRGREKAQVLSRGERVDVREPFGFFG